MVVPFLMTVALGVATMVASHHFWTVELDQTLTTSPVIGWIFRSVMTVLGGAVLFLIAQPLLLAVFVDRLSERVERNVRGAVPTVPFFASAGLALVHGLLKLVLYGIALAVGLVLTAATGGVGSLVGIGLAALFLAFDGFDYPLARRQRDLQGQVGLPPAPSGDDHRIRRRCDPAVSDPVRRFRGATVRRGWRDTRLHGRRGPQGANQGAKPVPQPAANVAANT